MESLKERLLEHARWHDKHGCAASAVLLREASEALGVSPPADLDVVWSVEQIKAQCARVLAGDSPNGGLLTAGASAPATLRCLRCGAEYDTPPRVTCVNTVVRNGTLDRCDGIVAAAPASAPPETRYEFYQRLRQTPQFAQAEMEASAPRLYASEVKRDPEKAIRRIEKLRELLAWFTLRYQLEHEKPASAPPEGIAAYLSDNTVREMWRSVQGPYAELNGPLIRFAALLFEAGRQQGFYHDQSCAVCGIRRAAHPGMGHAFV